ncbi:NADPH-dependent FMN reductase [Segetibacter aerophilus]|uniref:FMN reductase n=1 Tax=Segetibacter aerophilus TaxID=670293 RepID=A0A512BHT6_9BACT|nr:NADPH-dependent FMN reductase [Segetibacter aerophilus]GEO11435.1 FMN reductase [Segetibacter aerophilus]
MPERKKVLALCGSTRSKSTNLNFIEAVAALGNQSFEINMYPSLAALPHFNPDLDTDTPPSEVAEFRRLIVESDGVLICTPEYALGVPGSLKNALDWLVSSCELSHKPVALITAATSGAKAHESLLGTLQMIEAEVGEKSQLLISFAKTKINYSSEITDKITLAAIEELIEAFTFSMHSKVLSHPTTE